ncbi:MAG: carbamoyltransferase HypF [Gaiellales bacterium]|nr:MAG: carbamoyltransferase HypF [Gaiellales bacterium]
MADTGSRTSQTGRSLITVTGVVQGVGFRPFIYRLARRFGLSGEVINDSTGVRVDVEGEPGRIESFIIALREESPPRAAITSLSVEPAQPLGQEGFVIGSSLAGESTRLLVSPDSCTCDQCLAELFDPDDRRYRYPFINCTNCGPRFTIIEELPYDRRSTTMKRFVMCPECRAEYDDPADRRFHAEPNACPVCGPGLWLADRTGAMLSREDPVLAAAAALRSGRIVALKSLGGFQLACAASDQEAVLRLRERKRRPHKPFALMAASSDDAALICAAGEVERRLLESVERPIVLLDGLEGSGVAAAVAPGMDRFGVMLPYTPLHFLLMAEMGEPLVMTSGNLSEEPICRTNTEALSRLADVADLFLMHNRQIRSTYDDSVLMVEDGRTVMLRRARGYAPLPVSLPLHTGPILATGAELKNTFCLTKGDEAFLSQHIGDLENVETLLHYERTEMLYESLFSVRPSVFVCDRHPGYLSTTYCHERDRYPLAVQHHHAHIAACLAENGFTGEAVGIAFDGTGFGDDGHVWGGEFFTGGLQAGFERAAHLDCFPLLGGDAAVREPWRAALAAVWRFVPERLDFCAAHLGVSSRKLDLLLRQLEAGLNCPETSSGGRLFDAVAALALGRLKVSYEAQGAMELEAAALRSGRAGRDSGSALELDDMAYRFSLNTGATPWTLSPERALTRIIGDIKSGSPPGSIAALFHLGLAEAIVRTGARLAERRDLGTAALSGGAFQNRLLLRLVRQGLEHAGLRVLTHSAVPPNDGGVSLGQAALAAYYQRGRPRPDDRDDDGCVQPALGDLS